jgi:hypothetical protein
MGQFTFEHISNLHVVFMRPATIQKLWGVDQSVMTNIGTYGALIWSFQAELVGSTYKTQLASAKSEFNRPDPIYFIADMESTDSGWGYILKMVPTEFDEWANYYTVDVVFAEILHASEASRGTVYGEADESTSFTAGSVVPTSVVPLPVGAGAGALTDPTETVDFTRYSDNGAGGAYAVPCLLQPDLDWTTYGVAEADLAKAAVTFTKSGREVTLSNGMIKVLSRNDEANTKGHWELYYYNGTIWIYVGLLSAYAVKSGGNYQNITGSTVGPKINPRWKMTQGLRKGLRALYPATATDSLQAWLHLEMDYGKPILKVWLENACSTDFTGHVIHVDLYPTDFRYWTRLGTEEDANAAAYGTPEVDAGDADDNPSHYVATTAGAPAAATILLGMVAKKKADRDLSGYDAGAYWSYLRTIFDNVTIKNGFSTEPVWIFCGRYDKIGSRTGPQLALEALARMNVCNTLVPNI